MDINTVLQKEPVLQAHELPVKRFLFLIMEIIWKIWKQKVSSNGYLQWDSRWCNQIWIGYSLASGWLWSDHLQYSGRQTERQVVICLY